LARREPAYNQDRLGAKGQPYFLGLRELEAIAAQNNRTKADFPG